jgi:chemotaxis signal transduction protein
VIENAKIRIKTIDEIVLIGETRPIPTIQRLVAGVFRSEVMDEKISIRMM